MFARRALLRHELVHSWQYRRGGLLNLTKLIVEQINKNGNYPYETPGTLENEASTKAFDGTNLKRRSDGYSGFGKPRPWELQCSTCDRFY